MDYQSLAKLVNNKYGLRFTKIAAPGPAGPTHELTLRTGQPPFMVLRQQAPVQVDAHCYSFAGAIRDLPGFGPAFFHHDQEWVGFELDTVSDRAAENMVDYAFKAAVNAGQSNLNRQQYVILPADNDDRYQAQSIPQPVRHRRQSKQQPVPAALEKALLAYDYTLLPGERRDKNFYTQGKFLADYEDTYQKFVPLKRYYPTYHMLDLDQLRTYFAWRTSLRQGTFLKVSDSYLYLYIYELLNNIGVASPIEGFHQLVKLKTDYRPHLSLKMEKYLDRWLRDYVLYYRLDHAVANQVFATEIAADHDYYLLLHPEEADAATLTAVFDRHSTYLKRSRLYQKSADHFQALLKQVWQAVLNLADGAGKQYFNHYVASQELTTNYLFGNAVFYFQPRQKMVEYSIDSVRRYRFKGRQYYCTVLKPRPNERQNLNTFLHEIDRLIRQQFKLGQPLKPRWLPAAILGTIKKEIANYQQRLVRAHQPQVHIDLGDLDQIRQDADQTRESLLTTEERQAIAEEQSAAPAPQPLPQPETQPAASVDLTADQLFLLRALLTRTPWKDYLKQHHLMVSILADQVNAALFDEIGDDVIEFNQDDQPVIVEDYRPELTAMFLTKEERY